MDLSAIEQALVKALVAEVQSNPAIVQQIAQALVSLLLKQIASSLPKAA